MAKLRDGHTSFFGSNAWISFWRDMATKYKGNADIVAFELFNEPFFRSAWDGGLVTDWNKIFDAYAKCTDAIRAIDPSRTVIWGDPQDCNILPRDKGFNGWYGHVLEKYLPYKDNMVFDFHRHAAPFTCYDTPRHSTAQQCEIAAMKYVHDLGFRVWLGEFSATNENTASLATGGIQFVVDLINWCVGNNVGFSLWEYRIDHYCPPGTYDKALAQSNYALYV